MVNDAIEASQDFGEQNRARLDAHLENIRIYDANALDAGHRSLRELQYEHDGRAGECFDPELSPVVIPPDDADSDASNAYIPPDDVTTSTVPVLTPTPSVIHICDTPSCRRRPESDPCGLQQISEHICCGICLFSDGRQHTAICNSVNLTTALALAPTPSSSANGGSNAGGSAAPNVDDIWRPGWRNYGADASGNSDDFATGRQHNTANNPAAPLGDRDRSAPTSEESVTGPMLVQHDIKPVVTAVTSSSAFLRTFLPMALTVFVACYGLFSVSDFADPASRYGLPVKVIGGVESDPNHYARSEGFYGCPDSDVLSFHDIRRLVLGLESGDMPIFKCGILELTATCFGRCPLRKIHTGVTDLDTNRLANLANDDLFGNWGVRLVAALKPLYVLYQMTPPYSGSYKSHAYVTQKLLKLDYLVSDFERFPCDLTGARTSRFWWVNVGVRQGPDDISCAPVDCVSGLLAEPLPFDDCLVSPQLCTKWCTGVWRPTEAIAASVGDEFYTRAGLVSVFVDHDGDPDRSLDKGRKIYGLGAPTTTLTSSNNFHFVDGRSSDPLHVGVRQLEFSEVLKISGFDDDLNATASLNS